MRWECLSLLIFCGALCMGDAPAKAVDSGNNAHEPYAAPKQPEPPPSAILAYGHAYVLAAQPPQKEPEERFFGLRADGWVAVFTLALTIGTGLLWWATRDAISDARTSSEHSTAAYSQPDRDGPRLCAVGGVRCGLLAMTSDDDAAPSAGVPPRAYVRFSAKVAREICWRTAAGETQEAICADAGMPNVATLWRWARKRAGFAKAYGRARAMGEVLLNGRAGFCPLAAREIVARNSEGEMLSAIGAPGARGFGRAVQRHGVEDGDGGDAGDRLPDAGAVGAVALDGRGAGAAPTGG